MNDLKEVSTQALADEVARRQPPVREWSRPAAAAGEHRIELEWKPAQGRTPHALRIAAERAIPRVLGRMVAWRDIGARVSVGAIPAAGPCRLVLALDVPARLNLPASDLDAIAREVAHELGVEGVGTVRFHEKPAERHGPPLSVTLPTRMRDEGEAFLPEYLRDRERAQAGRIPGLPRAGGRIL